MALGVFANSTMQIVTCWACNGGVFGAAGLALHELLQGVNQTETEQPVCAPNEKPKKVTTWAGSASQLIQAPFRFLGRSVKNTRLWQALAAEPRSGWNWAGRLLAGSATVVAGAKAIKNQIHSV